MIGSTISHYAPKAHPPLADKILEKLGEVRNSPTSVFLRVEENFRIPLKRSESGRYVL
jgi:hypothetical protein